MSPEELVRRIREQEAETERLLDCIIAELDATPGQVPAAAHRNKGCATLPLVLDLQGQRVYAYPYADYKAAFSERSRMMLESAYEEAGQKNQIVLFVGDEAMERMVSFLLNNK